jgi:hypothetical protein
MWLKTPVRDERHNQWWKKQQGRNAPGQSRANIYLNILEKRNNGIYWYP